MKFNNEKGVTLVELLAVLALLSMVTVIIFTTFFITMKYNITETKKTKMQQEANYIITKILQKHRTIEHCYNLDVIDAGRKIVFSDCSDSAVPGVEEIIADSFLYSLTDLENEVYPKSANFKTTLIVKDPKNPNLAVTVDTEFKRYKN